MNGKNVIRLLMALTILVSVFLRPPGTMLVLDGGAIAYEICTGGETKTVTVTLGGDEQQKEIDLGCDFFAAQIGALPFVAPNPAPVDADPIDILSAPAAAHLYIGQAGRTANGPRAPPLVS